MKNELHKKSCVIVIRRWWTSQKQLHCVWPKVGWGHTASRYKMIQIGRTVPCPFYWVIKVSSKRGIGRRSKARHSCTSWIPGAEADDKHALRRLCGRVVVLGQERCKGALLMGSGQSTTTFSNVDPTSSVKVRCWPPPPVRLSCVVTATAVAQRDAEAAGLASSSSSSCIVVVSVVSGKPV